jgi:hypothetical protein
MKTLKILATCLLIQVIIIVSTAGLTAVHASPTAAIVGSTLYAKPGTFGDCLTWDTACDLQVALNAAFQGDEIQAAAGTYFPTASVDRSVSFLLRSGIAIYGGFPPDGGAWEERDWQTYPTVLSGDIGISGDTSDNSYNVVRGSGSDETALLDGFIISGGNAAHIPITGVGDCIPILAAQP